MLSVSNLTMTFGDKTLFENVSVKFEQGGHYGLIGANGCGKSTFVKILSGLVEASAGQISLPKHCRMASLNQDQYAFDDYTVLEATIMGHKDLWAVQTERDALYALPEMSEEQGMRAAELEMQFAEFDGYTAEARAAELLTGVGIEMALHDTKMGDIPPALKLRVLLTQVLFCDPDVMLLDEPTNNLDINTIRWLEKALIERDCTMIIVSHDRHFLNAVCTHTADLDYGNIQLFPGAYDEYMLMATRAREKQQADQARKKAKVAELQAFVRRFSANASKSRQATSRLKQIDKIQLDEIKPSSRKYPYMKMMQEKKLHRVALTIEDIALSYEGEPPVIEPFTLRLEAGQKLAIIGDSGIGKSTLIKAIMSVIQPQQGTVKWAENAVLGYLAQDHGSEFANDMTVFDWMQQWASEEDDETSIRGALGRMLFSGDAIKKPVKVLSGGEKVRLLIGKFVMMKPNVLVLDDPTNHLDMESIESLNMALENYDGTIILVSHDRQLVSSVATQILDIRSAKDIEFYLGGYDSYLSSKGVIVD